MTNKTLQYLIYNQLYSASMYELLALQAPTKILENQMKLFQEETLNNASYLDRYYQELNTSSYHPIIQEPVDQGSFKKNVYWMLEYESSSTKLFCNESYNANNDEKIKTLTSYISSSIVQRNTKLTNIYINILDEEIKKTPPKWCNWQMVTRTGFEPVNACVKGMWVNRFSNEPHGAWSRTRTYDRSVNSRLLYQLSYRGII